MSHKATTIPRYDTLMQTRMCYNLVRKLAVARFGTIIATL